MQKILRHPSTPLVLLIAANLLVGALTFRDFGLSWDEPLFYAYGRAVGYAYSIPEHLSGDFQLDRAYGPSSDHALYGPAYLLLARNPAAVLEKLFSLADFEPWRLVNFTTFQVGGVLLYFFCRRWMGRLAAFGATLLFTLQPMLWGHAFINPKDIPFMVFFLAAMLAGYRMVDRLSALPAPAPDPAGAEGLPAETSPARRRATWIFTVCAGFCLLALLLWAFSGALIDRLSSLIHTAYEADAATTLGKLFASVAPNAQSLPEEGYLVKGQVLFARARNGLLAVSLSLSVLVGVIAFQPGPVRRLWAGFDRRIGPMPTWPSVTWPFPTRKQGLRVLAAAALGSGILLGLLTSIRVLGPLAGFLVAVYYFLRHERRPLSGLFVYGLVAILVMFATWPYLWEAPASRFFEVFVHMASNPKILPVLYQGEIYPSDGLPVSYLPYLLGVTLSEPIWFLVVLGLAAGLWGIRRRRLDWRSLAPVGLWFLIPFGYVLLRRPPVYDGYRHFLFMLPPVFVAAGLALQAILDSIRSRVPAALAVGALYLVAAVPGIYGIAATHPYEYAYFNAYAGGLEGAFRHYETDYWLTCYPDAIRQVNHDLRQGKLGTSPTLYVLRQPRIARTYADSSIAVEAFDPEGPPLPPGSLVLITTRTNNDRQYLPDHPVVYRAGLNGLDFCVIKIIE